MGYMDRLWMKVRDAARGLNKADGITKPSFNIKTFNADGYQLTEFNAF